MPYVDRRRMHEHYSEYEDDWMREKENWFMRFLKKIVPYILIIFTIILIVCIVKFINYIFNYSCDEYDDLLDLDRN